MDTSFRTAQAVSDLIHHVKPLLSQHLAAVAEASGMTLAETGEAFRLLRDDGYVFRRDETMRLFMGLHRLGMKEGKGFELALVVLLADALQNPRTPDFLIEVWAEAVDHLSNWPATLRAAAANGLRQAKTHDRINLFTLPEDKDYLTRPADLIADHLLRIARSMRRDELYEVARADYGSDLEKHFAALLEVIGKRDGIFLESDAWFPSEVIELTSHTPGAPGHEGCTAILLLNALKTNDSAGWFDFRWQNQGAAYCALRPSVRDPILAGIRHLYETDPEFLAFHTIDPSRLGEGATIPVVDDL
jgi:hypothetical protein